VHNQFSNEQNYYHLLRMARGGRDRCKELQNKVPYLYRLRLTDNENLREALQNLELQDFLAKDPPVWFRTEYGQQHTATLGPVTGHRINSTIRKATQQLIEEFIVDEIRRCRQEHNNADDDLRCQTCDMPLYLARVGDPNDPFNDLVVHIQQQQHENRHVVAEPRKELQRNGVRFTWLATTFKRGVTERLTYCKHGDQHSVLKAVLKLRIGLGDQRTTREVAVVQPLEKKRPPQASLVPRNMEALPKSLKECFERNDNVALQIVQASFIRPQRFTVAPVVLQGPHRFRPSCFYLLTLRSSTETDWWDDDD
jgi:hypothetical protein